MAQFLRDHSRLLIGVGVGIAIGTGAATLAIHFLNHNISAEIGRLAAKVESLKHEVNELKLRETLVEGSLEKNGYDMVDKAETLQLRRQGSSSFFSAHGSSGEEDDDEFEDTIEG